MPELIAPEGSALLVYSCIMLIMRISSRALLKFTTSFNTMSPTPLNHSLPISSSPSLKVPWLPITTEFLFCCKIPYCHLLPSFQSSGSSGKKIKKSTRNRLEKIWI